MKPLILDVMPLHIYIYISNKRCFSVSEEKRARFASRAWNNQAERKQKRMREFWDEREREREGEGEREFRDAFWRIRWKKWNQDKIFFCCKIIFQDPLSFLPNKENSFSLYSAQSWRIVPPSRKITESDEKTSLAAIFLLWISFAEFSLLCFLPVIIFLFVPNAINQGRKYCVGRKRMREENLFSAV